MMKQTEAQGLKGERMIRNSEFSTLAPKSFIPFFIHPFALSSTPRYAALISGLFLMSEEGPSR